MDNTIWNLIEPVAGEHTGDVIRWLAGRGERLKDSKGIMIHLNHIGVRGLNNEVRGELARYICSEFRLAPDRDAYQPAKPQAQEDRPAHDFPKAASAPKPRQEAALDPPRREYDDETLARLVLEFLREHRTSAFTYNQVKDALNIEWKQASRVLQSLAKRGGDVVRYDKKTKKGEKLELYKFAPHRKALDRDYSRAEEIVSGALLEYLSDEPHQSGTAIREAMQAWFGHVNDHLVRAALQVLVDDEKVTTVPGPRRSTLHSVCISM